MDISIAEKRLEDYIFSHLNGTKIIYGVEPEITPVRNGCVLRQLNLGDYGVADIVTIDVESVGAYPIVTVYELKQGKIDAAALVQVLRYKKGLSHFLEILGYRCPGDAVTCVLIGNDICHIADFAVAVSSLSEIDVYSYDLCPNTGLILHRHAWEKEASFPQSLYKAFLGAEYAASDAGAQFYKEHGEVPF